MKKRILICVLSVCLALAFCLGAAASEAQPQADFAFSLRAVSASNMESDALTVGMGDKIRIRIYAAGEALASGTYTLQYNTDAFGYTAAECEAYDGKISTTAVKNEDGSITFTSEVAASANFSGSVLVATVYFNSLADSSETAYQFTLASGDAASAAAVTVSITHRHAFGAWTTVSVSEDGTMQKQKRTCLHCDAKEEREIPLVDYSISLKEGATKIQFDATNKLLHAIAPDTTVGTLLDKLTSKGNMQVIDKNGAGQSRNDKLATGMTVLVMDEGEVEATVQYSATVCVWGDADGNGKVTADEARLALRASAGLEKNLTSLQILALDSDANGTITSSDARFLLRTSAGLDAFYAVQATNIVLNKKQLDMTVGSTEKLTAAIMPADTSFKTVSWKSSNSAVASVVKGVVTAKGVGTATITATAQSGVQATCTVTVTNPVRAIEYKRVNFYLPAGKEIDLSDAYTVVPSTADTTGAVWSVSDSAFTVKAGKVSCSKAYSAVANKNATVTCTYASGIKATFKITLIPEGATCCHFNYETLQVSVGQKFKLSGSIFNGAALKLVSSDTNVLAVGSDNVLTAKGIGVATVKCEGVDYSETVTVYVMSGSLRVIAVNVNQGNADLSMSVKNTSAKAMSQVAVYLSAYDKNGTKLEEKVCGIKDLAANSGVKTINWTNEVWSSDSVAAAKITKIVITFADGTKETIPAGCWYVGE